MSYLFQAILLLFFLTCALMVEAFWTGLQSEKGLSYSLVKSLLTGGSFILYALLDYLMIVPGAGYLMA